MCACNARQKAPYSKPNFIPIRNYESNYTNLKR